MSMSKTLQEKMIKLYQIPKIVSNAPVYLKGPMVHHDLSKLMKSKSSQVTYLKKINQILIKFFKLDQILIKTKDYSLYISRISSKIDEQAKNYKRIIPNAEDYTFPINMALAGMADVDNHKYMGIIFMAKLLMSDFSAFAEPSASKKTKIQGVYNSLKLIDCVMNDTPKNSGAFNWLLKNL